MQTLFDIFRRGVFQIIIVSWKKNQKFIRTMKLAKKKFALNKCLIELPLLNGSSEMPILLDSKCKRVCEY